MNVLENFELCYVSLVWVMELLNLFLLVRCLLKEMVVCFRIDFLMFF